MDNTVIWRVIAIIAALLIIALIFIFALKWNVKENVLETLDQAAIEKKVESICPKDRQSPEMTFLQLNGDCGACKDYDPGNPKCNPFCNDQCTGFIGIFPCCQDDRYENAMGQQWECNAPEGGECIVTKMSHYQWVYNGCEESFWIWITVNGAPIPVLVNVPIEEFTDYKIYDNTMSGALLYESYKYCNEHTNREGNFGNICCGDKCKYSSSVSPVMENKGVYDAEQVLYFYKKFVMAREYDSNPDFTACEGRNFVKEDEEFHHYEFKVSGRYCCPEGKKWDDAKQNCCAEEDCSDLTCDQEGGTWLYSECWFFGMPGQNCRQVCTNNGFVCKNPDDWTAIPKDCALHSEVLDDQDITNSECIMCLDSDNTYAPFTDFVPLNKRCYYKDDYTQPYDCNSPTVGRRICACQI